MDFRVGGPARTGSPAEKTVTAGTQLEAKVLAVRAPRSRTAAVRPHGERRKKPQQKDPAGGRVLVLMIPAGNRLPAGLERGEYRVFVRFAKR
jgi:hypothetical protein